MIISSRRHKISKGRLKAKIFRLRPTLNLVSMMDIFTILLLFLITFAGEDTILPTTEKLKLPLSTSDISPKTTTTIIVTNDDIIVEGKKVESVADIIDSPELLLKNLKKELIFYAERAKFIAKKNSTVEFQGNITILGDKRIPFKLLKKIMFTSSEADFSNISLAVLKKESAG
ncbi:MAG: ExbD/TolR family protein [Nitrospirota bacterium]